tara:strand:+ start:311 stop:445 length:135 start_codon:yes stop_codon:yes gene_type:complete
MGSGEKKKGREEVCDYLPASIPSSQPIGCHLHAIPKKIIERDEK